MTLTSDKTTCDKIQTILVSEGAPALQSDPVGQDHLVSCANCFAFLEALHEVDAALTELPVVDVSDPVFDSLLWKIDAPETEAPALQSVTDPSAVADPSVANQDSVPSPEIDASVLASPMKEAIVADTLAKQSLDQPTEPATKPITKHPARPHLSLVTLCRRRFRQVIAAVKNTGTGIHLRRSLIIGGSIATVALMCLLVLNGGLGFHKRAEDRAVYVASSTTGQPESEIAQEAPLAATTPQAVEEREQGAAVDIVDQAPADTLRRTESGAFGGGLLAKQAKEDQSNYRSGYRKAKKEKRGRLKENLNQAAPSEDDSYIVTDGKKILADGSDRGVELRANQGGKGWVAYADEADLPNRDPAIAYATPSATASRPVPAPAKPSTTRSSTMGKELERKRQLGVGRSSKATKTEVLDEEQVPESVVSLDSYDNDETGRSDRDSNEWRDGDEAKKDLDRKPGKPAIGDKTLAPVKPAPQNSPKRPVGKRRLAGQGRDLAGEITSRFDLETVEQQQEQNRPTKTTAEKSHPEADKSRTRRPQSSADDDDRMPLASGKLTRRASAKDRSLADKFLAERAQTKGLRFIESAGYWSNTYTPGDPNVRLLQARLSGYDRSGLSQGNRTPRLDDASRQYAQTFDPPTNSALDVFLHADQRSAQRPTRLLVQVGLQGTRKFGGHRPDMNVGVVLDLRGSISTDLAANMRAIVLALQKAKESGDRFTLTVAGRAGGTIIGADEFRYGPISVAMGKLMRASQSTGLDLPAAVLAAASSVARADDPSAPLGSSLVLLVTPQSLDGHMPKLIKMAHTHAVSGIPMSVVGVGGKVKSNQITQLALAGQGNRRFLTNAANAASIVKKELSAVAAVVARAVRLRIRLAPGVKLVNVIGSKRLDAQSAQKVREAERHIDLRMARNLGVAADRGDDEAGIQIVIPAYYADDAHIILLDVVAPGPRPHCRCNSSLQRPRLSPQWYRSDQSTIVAWDRKAQSHRVDRREKPTCLSLGQNTRPGRSCIGTGTNTEGARAHPVGTQPAAGNARSRARVCKRRRNSHRFDDAPRIPNTTSNQSRNPPIPYR